MGVTSIEWTGTALAGGEIIPGMTFNPWIGCTRKSEGCRFCYAEADMDHRRHRVKWGPAGTRSMTSKAYWEGPLRWNQHAADSGVRRKVFCASLADWLEDWQGHLVDAKGERLFRRIDHNASAIDGSVGCTLDDARALLLNMIRQTPALDWLLLTKRPENWRRLLWSARGLVAPDYRERDALVAWIDGWLAGQAPANVWAGVSCENQETAYERIPLLLDIPAAVRFLSCEPLLGPIDFRRVPGFNRIGLDLSNWWIIGGGESGPHARPCRTEWLWSLRDQCRSAGVPFFCKQLGSNPVFHRDETPLYLRDKKGGDIDEFPEGLRIREFPRVPAEALA